MSYNPFLNNRRRFPFRRINTNGTPLIFSHGAITHLVDAIQVVTFSIHPFIFRFLPAIGVFLFEVRHLPQPTPAPTDPVFLSISGNPLGSPSNRIPLMLPNGTQATAADISVGGRYFVYYNKCDCSFQLLNVVSTPTPAPAPAPTPPPVINPTIAAK